MADAPTWVIETADAVERASDADRARRESEGLGTAKESLDARLAELTELGRAAAAGRGTWWSGVDAPPDLWNNLRSAQQDLSQRALGRTAEQLAVFTTRAKQAALGFWDQHVVGDAGDVNELKQFAAALRNVSALRQVADDLDSALGELGRLRSKLPDSAAVESLARAVALLDDLEARLPPTVRSFVSAATGGGAALDQLDAEVLNWLVAHGASDVFKIVPGRPVGTQHG
ncbi:hypothetical protein G7043_39745 [Lentzea sp. NEAU-D13]|uniref:Uncharacterized protein n=1 Tax=Lentzea alba TaxID=2714351 RepID=A0A7C9RWH8_9PSEU|nr:hypothetical protein [Lentzea alba]NGY65065.1 hypothetical protein [Lentzea alba]